MREAAPFFVAARNREEDVDDDTRFTIRLLDAAEPLEYGSAVAGESRSEFMREAVRQRARRLEREMTTEEGDPRE